MKNDDRIARVAAHEKAVRNARQLGLFSVAVGLAGLLAPRAVGRLVGLEGRETLLRLHGLRQIVTGVGLLGSADPRPAMWARVGGDVLEASTLVAGIVDGSPGPLQSASALVAVTGALVVDTRCALALGHAPASDTADYSDRSGFPQPPKAMRGAALKNFTPPSDLVGPQAMRSWAP